MWTLSLVIFWGGVVVFSVCYWEALTMAMQEWFDAMAAKDIDAVMATFHEDFLCVMNEQLLTR